MLNNLLCAGSLLFLCRLSAVIHRVSVAAESGRIPKGAFVRWEMQLLSVTRHGAAGEC